MLDPRDAPGAPQVPARHILLTGGAGFIGSHTAEALLDRGDRVTVLDALDFGYDAAEKRANLARMAGREGFRFVQGDLRDGGLLDALLAQHRPEVVLHLAARAGVRQSLLDPSSYVSINVRGTVTLLEAMQRAGLGRLVFASSSSVYGVRSGGAFDESQASEVPASPYAASKRAGELLCGTWHHLYGLQSTCLRFFTVYGPRQRPDMAIRIFTERISRGEPVRMFGDGSSARDYTYVSDIVQGVLAAVDRPLGHVIVNLGNRSPTPLRELIEAIGRTVGREPVVEQVGEQPGDVPLTCADISRARDLLDYEPQVSLEEGLRATADWVRARL